MSPPWFYQLELDHKYNPGDGSNDIVYDHIGIHSAGRGSNTSALSSSELAPPRVWDVADGKHHLVKVCGQVPAFVHNVRFIMVRVRIGVRYCPTAGRTRETNRALRRWNCGRITRKTVYTYERSGLDDRKCQRRRKRLASGNFHWTPFPIPSIFNILWCKIKRPPPLLLGPLSTVLRGAGGGWATGGGLPCRQLSSDRNSNQWTFWGSSLVFATTDCLSIRT